MFQAINYAAVMTFRPAVAKIMIIVSCDLNFSRKVYAEASVMFDVQDIKMHYLLPDTMRLKNKSMGDIYGFDRRSVYTHNSLNTRHGEETLRIHLRTPKDSLSALAIKSGGSVFSQTHLTESSRSSKAAASIFGRQVARTGVPSQCQV